MRKVLLACVLSLVFTCGLSQAQDASQPIHSSESMSLRDISSAAPEAASDDGDTCRQECAEDGADPDECQMDCNTIT